MRRMTRQLFDRSKPHQDILAECGKELAEKGQFRKAAVIAKLGYEDVADSINWDAITSRLKEGVVKDAQTLAAVDLYPVAESFFKASAAERAAIQSGQRTPGRADGQDDSFPGRYIAHGHGKKAVGYVLATHADGRFANYVLKLRIEQSNGKRQKAIEQGKRVVGKLISEGKTTVAGDIVRAVGIRPPSALKKLSS